MSTIREKEKKKKKKKKTVQQITIVLLGISTNKQIPAN